MMRMPNSKKQIMSTHEFNELFKKVCNWGELLIVADGRGMH